MRATSVVTETESEHGIATERVLQELAVTLGAKVVSPMMARLDAGIIKFRFGNSLEHLVQLCQMIHIVFHFFAWWIHGRMDIDLDDVTSLIGDIDLALTTIANVVDHQ